MKTYLKCLLTAVLLSTSTSLFTGCTTTDSGGNQVFDPVKTAQVRESIKPVVSTAIRVWMAKEPNPAYREAASAFSDVICQMRDAKEFDSRLLANRLNDELTKRGLATDVWAATAKDLIVSQFNIWIADKINADLPPDEYAWNIMDVLCDGIKSGLGESASAFPFYSLFT